VTFTCDHLASKASLDAFTSATNIIGVQVDGDGGHLLLGRCVRCDSTLAVEISLARGHVAHGEIPPDSEAEKYIR
jgi:hypothetical protein